MSERTIWEVWKVPDHVFITEDPWAQNGIYPKGERMTVAETHDEAVEAMNECRENSPSEEFGESMDDAPYRFFVEGVYL